MNTDKTSTELQKDEADGATVTEDYMRPRFEGEVTHQRLSRCRTCWAAVWNQDEERHTAWHRGGAA